MNDAVLAFEVTPDNVSAVNILSEHIRWSKQSKAQGSARPSFVRYSVTVAAVLIFVLLNVYAQYAWAPVLSNRFVFQNRDSCWWAANNFISLKKSPGILLVGSSLMCRVVNEGDATFLHHSLNAGEHYRSEHLEQLLSSPQRSYRTTSLAVGGMNASDVGSLVPALIKKDKKPYAIIYGIAPRDLFDNSLTSPSDAVGFRLAEKIYDFEPPVMAMAYHSREAQFNCFVNRCLRAMVPIYNFQDELSIFLRRIFKFHIDSNLPRAAVCDSTVATFSQIQLTKLNLLPEDTQNNCLVKPDDPQHPDQFDFRNNYFLSYNPFKPALYRRQVFFLERFLKYTHDQGIKTVVIKMPLRRDNYGLMPPLFYQVYSRDIDRLSREYGAMVIDAAASPSFTDSDFTDTVHMSGFGSCKLVELIAPTIKKFLEQK